LRSASSCRVVHAAARQRDLVAEEDIFGDRQLGHQHQFLVDDDDAGRFRLADRLRPQGLAFPDNFAIPGAVRVDRRQHFHQG
jgi:hypothetical protein